MNMNSITVLMSTYNGSKYLREQIDSIFSQKNVCVSLLVRDDGSKDETREILEEYKKKKEVKWYSGDNLGSAKSFFNLLTVAPESDYYAFCDQDDLWDIDKLSIAISYLEGKTDKYAIYCCGTRIVDKDLNIIEMHKLDSRRSLTTHMIIAGVSGNTVVINKKLKDKLIQHIPRNIIMHDSWCFKVAICLGADVFIDPEPHISYRQHENNVVGMETSLKAKVNKFFAIINEKDIYKQLMEIKDVYSIEILPNYFQVLKLIEGNKKSIYKKMKLLFREDINFYNYFFNLAFKIKVITNHFS